MCVFYEESFISPTRAKGYIAGVSFWRKPIAVVPHHTALQVPGLYTSTRCLTALPEIEGGKRWENVFPHAGGAEKLQSFAGVVQEVCGEQRTDSSGIACGSCLLAAALLLVCKYCCLLSKAYI